MVPEQRGRELLADALMRRGFRRGADGRLERQKDGLAEVFDPATLEVTTRAAEERTAEAEAQQEVSSGRSKIGARRKRAVENGIKESLRRQEQAKLRADLAKRLAQTDEARRKELEDAAVDAMAEALQEKARQLGEVTSVESTRTETEFTLVIKIKE